MKMASLGDERQKVNAAPSQAVPKEIRNLLSGGLAGMVAKSVVAPMDRIKILYQVSNRRFHLWDVPSVAKRILQEEGLPALWKGNTATMIRVFPYSGIQFMTFDWCKKFFLEQHERHRLAGTSTHEEGRAYGLSPFESLISGSIAGVLSVICTYPLDLSRTQLAVMKGKRNTKSINFVQVLMQNYSEKGVLGLFRGITPTLLGILPYSGIAFTLNEQGKRYIAHYQRCDPTTIQKMECGALAGLCAQTVTYPLEVTRRRMQTVSVIAKGNAALDIKGNTKYSASDVSMFNIVRSLYHEQGVMGFFKGVTMNWLKGPVAFSISFTTFDIVKGMMETESERQDRHHKMLR